MSQVAGSGWLPLSYIVTMDDSIVKLNDEQLNQLENLASLRYSISEIELMLHIPSGLLKRTITNEESDEHKRYVAGKFMAQISYRMAVKNAADHGQEWAIKIMNDWSMKQNEEDLM